MEEKKNQFTYDSMVCVCVCVNVCLCISPSLVFNELLFARRSLLKAFYFKESNNLNGNS